MALIVFFIVVAVYISFRFEPKMALAAFVAMIHDLLVTVGVYSLVGFQVTPDTVIAILTILGYSLYDTVVVFDRVRDNTKGFGASGRMTYSEMVNLSMNQTLARSINTSLVAILPVLVGARRRGRDPRAPPPCRTTAWPYSSACISGAYSSIFIASPVLAMLKEREPRYAAIRQRLEARGERAGVLTPAAAAAGRVGRRRRRRRPGRSARHGAASAAPSAPGAAKARQPAPGRGGRPRPAGAAVGRRRRPRHAAGGGPSEQRRRGRRPPPPAPQGPAARARSGAERRRRRPGRGPAWRPASGRRVAWSGW